MKKLVYLSLLLIFLIPFSHAFANDTDLYILTQMMQQVPPDALILLDLSGSMSDPPWGSGLYYDPGTCSQWTNNCGDNVAYYPTSVSPNTSSCSVSAKYSSSSTTCSTGPLYKSSGSGHTHLCSGVPSTLFYNPGTCKQWTNNCGDNVAYYTTNTSPHTSSCDNSNNNATWGDSACLGPFYQSSGTGHTTNCSSSKLTLAKKAVFNFLDADNGTNTGTPDGTINSNDQAYLKIRMGYMRYYNCGSSSTEATTYPETNTSSYSSGCNTLIYPLNTAYSTIYCNSTSCTSSSSGSGTCVAKEQASGGTPLADALLEAKYYFDYTKSQDNDAACRQKFVILITDGDDTYACGNNGNEGQTIQYKGRREVVAQARQLANAGYYVFVVGFGAAMPAYLQNTLNWAAYYGKTKNTDATQSINQVYTIPYGQIYPAGVTQCMDSAYTGGGLVGGYEYYYANVNDPGQCGISGYAFIAQNESQLDDAITNIRNFIINLIAQSTSYVAPVVPISQFQSTNSENRLYLGMFKPTTTTMWKGNIKKYGIQATNTATLSVGDVIDANGTLVMTSQNTIKDSAQSYWSPAADGGDVEKGGVGAVLLASDLNSRNIYTYMGTSTDLTSSSNAFSKTNAAITPTLLGLTSTDTTGRNNVIDFIHGWDVWSWDSAPNGDGTFNKRNWILGAFIHSRPLVIHYGNQDVIYAGANDGVLHAFNDADGTELWGFIPPDLLPNLKNFNNSLASLQIFVDGSPRAYITYNYNSNGSIQSVSQAILIFGERRGGSQYYALDVTTPSGPKFLWSISPTQIRYQTTTTASTAYQELGQSWSTSMVSSNILKTPMTVPIMTGSLCQHITNGSCDSKKPVAFIGGGYDATHEDTTPAGTDTSGRAIYIVDVANGNQIWKYSHSNDANMAYCIPSDITAIDLYGDGLIEKLYVGDVEGQIWRFDLCSSTTGKCIPNVNSTANWSGKRVFTGGGKIFYPPDVTFEANTGAGTYNMLFFGTGDREKPNNTAANTPTGFDTLYAVKDYDTFAGTITEITGHLVDVTSDVLQSSTATQQQKQTVLNALKSGSGWLIRLNESTGESPNPGEKCDGAAVVLGGAVYYTTFTPTPVNTQSVCTIGTGQGNLYILQYQTGNAMFDLNDDGTITVSDRSMGIGAGIPSGIIVTVINGTVTGYGGVAGGVFSPTLSTSNSIIPLDWRIVF
jgi:Tfp pilus tip-associated adhesin PilY1